MELDMFNILTREIYTPSYKTVSECFEDTGLVSCLLHSPLRRSTCTVQERSGGTAL